MLQCIKLDDVLEICIKILFFIWDCHAHVSQCHFGFYLCQYFFPGEVLLHLYALFLQMYAGGWRRVIRVLLVVYVTFHLGSATTCTSQSKSHVRIDAMNVGLYGNKGI